MVLVGELAFNRFSAHRLEALAIALLFLVTILQSTMNIMLDVLVFIYCSRNVPFSILAWISLFVMCVTTIAVFLGAWLGLIDNYVSLTATRARSYLGFRYALYPSQFVFMITCLAVYICRNRVPFVVLLILIAANYLVYAATDSRLSFYLSVALLGASCVLRFTRKRIIGTHFCGIAVSSIFLISAAVSIGLAVVYDPVNPLLSYLDQDSLLGGRLRLSNSALLSYGVPLFGQRVDLIGNGLSFSGTYERLGTYNYIDALFVQTLVRYGLLSTVVFLGLLTAVSWRAWKAQNWGLVIVLVFIALHCVIDDLSLYLYFNPFLFLIGKLIPGQGDGNDSSHCS